MTDIEVWGLVFGMWVTSVLAIPVAAIYLVVTALCKKAHRVVGPR